MAAIEVSDLRKTYPRGVQALRGVSFAVEPGEIFGLLGPNGAGKSTTVRIITTLTRASGGVAAVAGNDVTRAPQAVRRSLGYVSQKSAVDEEATGRENLLLQGQLYGMRGEALRARVHELLAHFHLEEAAGRLSRTYSGGMRRRLDIAMALVHRPQVLILDEPTTGLDPESRAALWQDLTRLRSEQRLAVLLTTHYLDEADRLADRVAIVDRGLVVALDTPLRLKDAIKGDVVSVELEDEAQAHAAQQALRAQALGEVAQAGGMLRIQIQGGAQAIPQIVAAVGRAGPRIRSVNLHRPTLDDVYFHFTGHRFGEGEQDPQGGRRHAG